MQSQLYLQGRLLGNPEVRETRKGKLMVKALLETVFFREASPGQVQAEHVTLPILFFSQPATAVKDLKAGASLTIGAHLYGTRFQPDGVAEVKHGIQLVADAVFLLGGGNADLGR
jgi:hypothetical protein